MRAHFIEPSFPGGKAIRVPPADAPGGLENDNDGARILQDFLRHAEEAAMGPASPRDVTRWLQAWSGGDESALLKLVPLVYGELHRRARHFMRREHAGHSLQPTALIHEAYLRLVGSKPVDWHSRNHFYALSSRLMRQVLVDHARARRRHKRGGGAMPVSFDEAQMGPRRDLDVIRLDEALRALAETDERKSRVVEMRFFGGLSVEETAEVLGVSPQTVLRDWRLARAWLQREMKMERS